MRAAVLAALAVLAVSAAGCDKNDVLVRDIGGTVTSPAGHVIDEVEMSDPNTGQSTSSSVDSAGNFSVTVYGYGTTPGAVRTIFREQGKVIGVVGFSDGHGGTTTVFPVTDEPDPTASPQNGPSGGDSGPSNVHYVYAKINIDFGQIADKDGKGLFVSANNPLAHVDTDKDGTPDLKDDDDDGDGTPDATDPDANGNGVEDVYETDDENKDGIPDEVQAGTQGP